ncbi:Maf-domain-containing protein [Lentithecium fluviatile CBS 122367]|uniref:Maf-domain-containing protein n=1 Tax=Lentithecium fluviatile CBS 122367 TaxID=1168545 RepID=A0A6G1IT48_9PLEO|nr:Maf-domain-containing protein [Lentithecium fluviatile CBS 122367]
MPDSTPSEPPPPYEPSQSKPPLVSANSSGLSEPVRSPGPGPRKGPLPLLPLDLPALNLLRGRRVVLASASPRRKQLLGLLGLHNVEIVPSKFEENLPKTLSPYEYVSQTAEAKCRDVYRREIDNEAKGEPAIVIAADTIIISESGKILEKPRNAQHHLEMLKMLRDEGTHRVATAIAVMRPLESAVDPGYALESHVEFTEVKFSPNLSDQCIVAYIKTRDGNDKAGGYGIQSAGSVLIERIEGSYDNVVGLPLRVMLDLIEKLMEPEEILDDNMDNMFSRSDAED